MIWPIKSSPNKPLLIGDKTVALYFSVLQTQTHAVPCPRNAEEGKCARTRCRTGVATSFMTTHLPGVSMLSRIGKGFNRYVFRAAVISQFWRRTSWIPLRLFSSSFLAENDCAMIFVFLQAHARPAGFGLTIFKRFISRQFLYCAVRLSILPTFQRT
jgi:hypothetical protein